MLIEITNYYAKPGMADQVLAQRRVATRIRTKLGLASGVIMLRVDGDGPDVRWQCSFETEADFKKDMQARAASEDFADARKAMHTLLDRFERQVYNTVPNGI